MNVVVLVAVLIVAVVVVVCHRRIHSRESQTQCAYRRKDSSRLHEKNEGAPIWRGLGFYTGDYKAYRKGSSVGLYTGYCAAYDMGVFRSWVVLKLPLLEWVLNLAVRVEKMCVA